MEKRNRVAYRYMYLVHVEHNKKVEADLYVHVGAIEARYRNLSHVW